MARDLIPPPSPAGRPSADAGEREALIAATHDVDAPAGAPAAVGPSPFRARFGFILGALLGILFFAAVAFAVLLGTSPSGPQGVKLSDHWSTWEPPTSDPTQGAVAIAEHVGGDYRFNDGKQLVGVEGQTLQYQSLPLAVALRSSDGAIHNYGSNGLLFTLRGQGKDGRLIGEKPSKARHALLRREALELALYSFRYLDGINEVVTLLPPAVPSGKASRKAKAKPQLQAVYYRPGDLKPQLESPLSQTLDPGRLAPDRLSSIEKRRIDALTMPNLFLVSYQLAQNQLPYLVLDRPSTSG